MSDHDTEQMVQDEGYDDTVGSRFGSSTTLARSARSRFSTPTCSTCQLLLIFSFVGLLSMVVLSVSVHRMRLSTVTSYDSLCTGRDCLEATEDAVAVTNFTANPCANYSSFACGYFPYEHEVEWDGFEKTEQMLLAERNNIHIGEILESEFDPTALDSAVDKMKMFYKRCKNSYRNTKDGARPLVSQFNLIGGWAAIGPGPTSKWDFDGALQAAHGLFGTQVFFELNVEPDLIRTQDNTTVAYSIQLDPIVLGMGDEYWRYFLNDPESEKLRERYRRFIREVIGTVQYEIDKSQHKQPLDDAVYDIMEIETGLAVILNTTGFDTGTTTLANLQSETPFIDMVALFNSYFKGASITLDTQLQYSRQGYIEAVAALVANETVTVANQTNIDGLRKLNNYMAWRIMLKYINDIGWSYTRLNSRWLDAKWQLPDVIGPEEHHCYDLVLEHMGHAMSSVFVERHYGDDANDYLTDLAHDLRDSFIDRVQGYSWMSDTTKQTAVDKIQNLVERFGYPSWLADTSAINRHYAPLMILPDSTHMDNMLAIAEYRRVHAVWRVINATIPPEDRWPDHIFDTSPVYDPTDNSLYIPAGALQIPLFGRYMPPYWNFGAIGRMIVKGFVSCIGAPGMYFDKNGQMVTWYDPPSMDSFNKMTHCHGQLFNGTRIDGKPIGDVEMEYLAYFHLQELAAVQTIYKAFLKSDSRISKYDKYELPGYEDFSDNKMLFLAFGQTFCANRPEWMTLQHLVEDGLEPEALMLNATLTQSPEFSDSYKCDSPVVLCPGF